MYKILFRLDADEIIGYGHLIRCMALAAELGKSVDTIEVKFIMRKSAEIPYEVIRLKTQYTKVKAEDYICEVIDNEIQEMIEILENEKPDCIIIDNYGISREYIQSIRQYAKKIVLIDDCNPKVSKYEIDMIINGNCYAKEIDYDKKIKALLGSEYAIVRQEFRNCKKHIIRNKVEKIAISSGGSDPINVMVKMIQAAKEAIKDNEAIEVYVIIGAGFTLDNIKSIQKEIETNEKFVLVYHANMADIMTKVDFFVTASGSTLNELAATGTPSISIILSENQIMCGKEMLEKNVTMNLGWYNKISIDEFANVIKKIMNEKKIRMKMSQNGQKLIDGNGVKRITEKILELIKLKKNEQ